MILKFIILSLVLISNCLLSALSVETEKVIVVRGTVKHCTQWPDRVLDAQIVESNSPVTLLDAIEVEAFNLDPDQILSVLLDEIENQTRARPTSIWVEVLPPEKYETVIDEYILSTNYLLSGQCPDQPISPIPEVRDVGIEVKLMELKEKRRELFRQDEEFRKEQKREEQRMLELLDSTG